MEKKTKNTRDGWMLYLLLCVLLMAATPSIGSAANKTFSGVCPSFFIRDEAGAVINPVTGENADKPYSPRQTCGASGCHNYEKITEGYHFQQGKDEKPGDKLASLYPWVLSPGQYGGRW
jgi:hypothetical protein